MQVSDTAPQVVPRGEPAELSVIPIVSHLHLGSDQQDLSAQEGFKGWALTSTQGKTAGVR